MRPPPRESALGNAGSVAGEAGAVAPRGRRVGVTIGAPYRNGVRGRCLARREPKSRLPPCACSPQEAPLDVQGREALEVIVGQGHLRLKELARVVAALCLAGGGPLQAHSARSRHVKASLGAARMSGCQPPLHAHKKVTTQSSVWARGA